MEKWHCIFWTGIILGIVVTSIDFWVESIPYVVTIPIEIVSVILIFVGLIIRKSKKTHGKQDALNKIFTNLE